MLKTGKRTSTLQMNLFTGEWEKSEPTVRSTDVHRVKDGKVTPKWLSDCKEERILTSRLLEEISELGNLEKASRQVISNGGSPRIDGMTVKELGKWLDHHWRDLVQELQSGNYKPSLVKRSENSESQRRYTSTGHPNRKRSTGRTSITRFIEKRMKLKVNRSKSKVCLNNEINFLGHGFLTDGKLFVSKESERRLKKKVRLITKRNRGRSLAHVIAELNKILRGWLNYFRYAQMKKRTRALAGWINRRLRCYRLKQCKKAIGIYRFVKKLGVSEKQSWLLAGSSKGWWRLSGSPVAHEAMNNQWFKRLGLYIYLKIINV